MGERGCVARTTCGGPHIGTEGGQECRLFLIISLRFPPLRGVRVVRTHTRVSLVLKRIIRVLFHLEEPTVGGVGSQNDSFKLCTKKGHGRVEHDKHPCGTLGLIHNLFVLPTNPP